jgi:hypothetical protein
MEMISPYRSDMSGFFEELGAESAGRVGEKAWESEFAEMNIRAANAGEGEVVIHVHIQWPPDYRSGVKGTIHVRADELPRFTKKLRAFLRMPEGGGRVIVCDKPT